MAEKWYTKKDFCREYLKWNLTRAGLDKILKQWYVGFQKINVLNNIDKDLIVMNKVLVTNQNYDGE